MGCTDGKRVERHMLTRRCERCERIMREEQIRLATEGRSVVAYHCPCCDRNEYGTVACPFTAWLGGWLFYPAIGVGDPNYPKPFYVVFFEDQLCLWGTLDIVSEGTDCHGPYKESPDSIRSTTWNSIGPTREQAAAQSVACDADDCLTP